jgi:hypothetical protein
VNLKTTFTLLILALVGGAGWLYLQFFRTPTAASSKTLAVLQDELTPERVTRIDVPHGDHPLVLERGPTGEWSMPGNWPTRQPEVKELVGLLTGLRTRFVPVALSGDKPDLKDYGLDAGQTTLTVTVRADNTDYRLQFGEEPGESNRFSRPTFVRVDDRAEVVRLGPNLLATLNRPADYYQQRRLFPGELVKDADNPQQREQLNARSLSVKSPKATYTLTRTGKEWELLEPVKDRADPDQLKTVLTNVPDIWAEQFVVNPKKDLAAYGLADPEQTIVVTRSDGGTVTLLIGKQSQMKTRTVTRPAPPGGPPGLPRQPQQETVHEEYRYAKLQNNDQVFEIKGDKLKDVFVAVDTLRDARLARFRPEDARRVELAFAGQDIAIVKDKDRWRLQKPMEADAESSNVTELLDKLSNLQARDKDVLDKADAKAFELDPPAGTVKVTAEETKGEGDAKTTTSKTFTFDLGKDDADKKKLYVQMEGWPRVNLVEDSIVALLKRPALAYRGRRIFDFSSSELAKIEVEHGETKFLLQQEQNTWRLAAPVQAEADRIKADRLADDLSRLEAVEYVNNEPKPDDLETYGLAKPGVSATLSFTKTDKPAQSLLVGKQRGDKAEYFAKVASAPAVFVVKKETRDLLDQDSLAFRPLQIWQIATADLTGLRHQKDGQEYRLKHDSDSWKIEEPFVADAVSTQVQPMINDLANLRAERYEANVAKELGQYGLEKPYLRLVLTTTAKKEGEEAKEGSKEYILLLGKPTGEGAATRFAKRGDAEAIFVVSEKLATAVDRAALDFLDRKLLALDLGSIRGLRSTPQGGTPLTLKREKDTWQVESPGVASFTADQHEVDIALGAWANLQAERFVAYGPKVDAKSYGLDMPTTSVTVTLKSPRPDDDKAPPKPEQHTVALGKPVPDEAGAFYARLDNGSGVAVLSPATAAELKKTYLAFVDRTVLKLPAGEVTALERKMAGNDLEIVKKEEAWDLAKPAPGRADGATMDKLVEQLASLRAQQVAAYPVKDLQPFGLDTPIAVVTLRLADGKAHVVRMGKAVEETKAEAAGRYVLADDSKAVAVISGSLAAQLLAPQLQFRDRNLTRFADVDRILLDRGPRQAVFSKVAGTWKLTGPVEAEAEQIELEDFINALARLRADQLVADKPPDLKSYGLNPPEVLWRFQSGDKEVLGLLVGKHEKTGVDGQEKDGPRCYAKLAAGDLVFLLDPRQTTQALAEYRSRTIWDPLDAAQVQALQYDYAGNSFTLQKSDNTWHFAGRPDLQVRPEAVTETLDALARLRPERYVVDRDADLKLYGLEPPQLVVEVQTPTGKRTLQIGRAEGASKRLYAHVPEPKHPGVFIIGENEAGQILRDAKAFAQAPPKPDKKEADKGK